MLAIEKGAPLENKVDQILDMMRVFNARQLNFAQRLNQISSFSERLMSMVSNLNDQLSTKAPPEPVLKEEPLEPGIASNSQESHSTRPTGCSNGMNDLIRPNNQRKSFDDNLISAVNKLTLETVDCVASKIKKLNIHTPKQMKELANLIFKKAVNEPEFSEACAKLGKTLSSSKKLEIPAHLRLGMDRNETDFKRILLNICQNDFNRTFVDQTFVKNGSEGALRAIQGKARGGCHNTLNTTHSLSSLNVENRVKGRVRLQGSNINASEPMEAEHHTEKQDEESREKTNLCRFIGHLFILDMLTIRVMHSILLLLLSKREDSSIKILCTFLLSIGKHYENRLENESQALDSIMMELYHFARLDALEENPRLSPECGGLIEDVMNTQSNNWSKQETSKRSRSFAANLEGAVPKIFRSRRSDSFEMKK